MIRPWLFSFAAALLLIGCPSEGTTTDSSGTTTEAGTTEAGTTAGGTTESGTTEGSTTEGSTTEGSTTEGSTTEGSTTEGSTTEAGTTGGGTTEGGTTDGGGTTGGDELTPIQVCYAACAVLEACALGYEAENGACVGPAICAQICEYPEALPLDPSTCVAAVEGCDQPKLTECLDGRPLCDPFE